MKRIAALLLASVICICLVACSAGTTDEPDTNNTVNQSTTKQLPDISTTKKPEADAKKASKMKQAMSALLDVDDSALKLEQDGSFVVKQNTLNEQQMYSFEHSDEQEALAYKSIDKYVDGIRKYYPDGDEIKLFDKSFEEISYGENGIDSVNYIAVYINTQNQTLTVYADSTGKPYYAKCNFTW